MKIRHLLYTAAVFFIIYILAVGGSGCAQIGSPVGGPRDSIPPKLVSAYPKQNSTNFTGNKITLNFDEYIEVADVQKNVLVSPYPKTTPQVTYKFKTVTVKIKDTLQPNTTYSINFGDAIKDVNEGNSFRDFTYVFSTGNFIDSLTFNGNVVLAETGGIDTTIQILLYRNAVDSSVKKIKPDYIARIRGNGHFKFVNLPAGNYKVYALKDGDGSKTYNAKTELFAFMDKDIKVSAQTDSVTLYAYAEMKENKLPATPAKTPVDKKLKYAAPSGQQELLGTYDIVFNKPLKKFDTAGIKLTDTSYNKVAVTPVLDSTHKIVSFAYNWAEGEPYRVVISKDAITDSADVGLVKSDTLKIVAKRESDYGSVLLRFTNLDLSRHPVIQFTAGEDVKESYPITSMEWSKKLFTPGEYGIRILYDDNNNGKWDPGNYDKKIQPEKVIPLTEKLSVRGNWDNERDIKL